MIRMSLLVVLLLFSCKTNTSVQERESKVKFKILNDTIFDKDTIRLEIYNQENKTIFIPIDFNWRDSYLSTDGHQKNYYPNFILQKQDSIFSPLILIRTIHGPFTANYPTFLTSKKNIVTITKKQKKVVLIPFSNNERIANNAWQRKLYTNEKGVYDFQLNYFLQKQIASKHLKEFYGVSLKENNIIHGNFYSNTVKLKIDSIYRDF